MKKQKFFPDGVTGYGLESDLFYKEYLDGPQGTKFELLQEFKHTSNDVMRAKNWLRSNRDVVSIHILSESNFSVYSKCNNND